MKTYKCTVEGKKKSGGTITGVLAVETDQKKVESLGGDSKKIKEYLLTIVRVEHADWFIKNNIEEARVTLY